MNVFSGYISERWRGFLQGIDQKPEAVRSYSFSGHRSRSLREPHDRWEKAAGGCLAGTSFRGTFPKAGVAFRRELTKSRKLSGGNIFSGYISKGWSGFSQRISPKLEAAWPERLFRAQFRRLVGLFARYRPKAEGCLKLHFFGLSQRVAWGASRSVGKGSRRLSGRNVFSGYISGRWQDFLQRIDQKPKAVWSCTFSGYRSGSLERFFEKD